MKFLARAIAAFVDAWIVMIALGMIHHSFDSRIPALGYWTTYFLVVIVTGLVSTAIVAESL